MEFFHRAKTVRLKSHHNKFLVADDDEENLKQHTNGAAPAAKWIVEFVEGKPNAIRLKSNSSWKYLSTVDDPHLLGLTGKRAVQASPRLKSNACVEWEPIKEGPFVKLRTHRGSFLRANGSLPPWRNSVTHDLPSSGSRFQDWVLWVVDILEIDHTAEAAAEQGKKLANDTAGTSGGGAAVQQPPPLRTSVSSNSSGSKTASPAGSFRSVRTPSPQRQEMASISRTSSASSNRVTPISSYSAAPSISEPAEEVAFASPYIKKLVNNSSKNSKLSNSFNNLESMIADADELLDGRKQKKKVPERDPSPESVQSHASSRHTPLEVRMAKQTLAEARDLDFESILASGKLKRVEKAIAVLIADESAGRSRTGNNTKLLNLRDQLQALRSERERAGIEMEEYEAFGVRKADMKADLQTEVGRARELQRREEELSEAVEGARRRRDELVRQLERLELEIKEAEEERAANELEIVEVCTVIGRRNAGVKETEREEEAWGRRKAAAEERLRRVEDDWGVFKVSLQMFEC